MPQGEFRETTETLSPVLHADDQMMSDQMFAGIATLEATAEQTHILTAEPTDDEVDILTTGEIYMSHVFVRTRLSHAFGVGAWSMRPMTREREADGAIEQMWGLYVRGAYVAAAWGSSQWNRTNTRQNRTDALESCKSNALTRCAKDLSIAHQLWDRRWATAWRNRMCVQVRLRDATRPAWRRRDADPFYNEIGFWNDPPVAEHEGTSVRAGQEVQQRQNAARTRQNRPQATNAPPADQTPTPPAASAPAPTSQAEQLDAARNDRTRVNANSERMISAEVFREGQGQRGTWKLYKITTSARVYSMFSYQTMADGRTGADVFSDCLALIGRDVLIDWHEEPRRDGRGTNNMLTAIGPAANGE